MSTDSPPNPTSPVEPDTSGLHLWLILWKAWAAVHSYALADIEQLGFGLSDFGILEILLHKGPLPVNEIGSRMHLTSGTMTVAIDRLEKRKLVERRDDPGDRRARVIHLTAEGTRIIAAEFERHKATMNELGEALTAEERKLGIELLKKLGRAAEAALARPSGKSRETT